MKISTILLLAAIMLPVSAAYAEPIPDYALDKDYANCMGSESDQSDPQRAQYCNCVRDGMRGWDLDTYGAAATEQSKSSGAEAVSQKVEALAKGCIAQVLK